jgi:hypothetical protein
MSDSSDLSRSVFCPAGRATAHSFSLANTPSRPWALTVPIIFDSFICFPSKPLISPLPQRQPDQELVRGIDSSGRPRSALTRLFLASRTTLTTSNALLPRVRSLLPANSSGRRTTRCAPVRCGSLFFAMNVTDVLSFTQTNGYEQATRFFRLVTDEYVDLQVG